MNRENPLIELANRMIEGKITGNEAFEGLKSLSISEEDLEEVLFVSKSLKEENPSEALIFSHLLFEASRLTGKMKGLSHSDLAYSLLINRRFPESVEFFDRAIEFFLETGNLKDLADCKFNKAIACKKLKRYSEAIEIYDEAIEIYKKLEKWKESGKCYLNKANVYTKLKKFDEAIKLYSTAEKLFEKAGNTKYTAECYLNKGEIYHHGKNYRDALEFYKKAEKLYGDTGKELKVARCYYKMAGSYCKLNNYDKALVLYDKGREVFERNGKWQEAAKCDYKKAGIYCKLNEYEKALSPYEKAGKIFKEHRKWLEAARCDYNKATPCHHLEKFEEALILYDKTRKVFKKYGEWPEVAGCDFNRANIYTDLQRFDKAIALYNKAEDIFNKQGDRIKASACDLGKAIAYRNLERFDKAMELYNKAGAVFEEYEEWIEVARCDYNRANIYFLLEDFDKAIEVYNKGREVFEKHKYEVEAAICDFGKANVYLYLKNSDEAIKFYDRAEEVFKYYKKLIIVAMCDLNRAYAYLSLEKFDEAIKFYNRAKEASSSVPEIEWKALRGLAQVYKAGNEPEKAIKELAEAVEVIEKRSIQVITPLDMKTSLREKSLFVYEDLINLLLKKQRFTEALEYVERTKSRNLVEMLSQRDIYPGGVPDKKRQEYQEFRFTLQSLERRWMTGFDESRRIQSDYKKAKEDYEKIKEEIQEFNPEFNDFIEVEKIKYSQIQELMEEKTALIEFFITDEDSVVFVVIKEQELQAIPLKDFNLSFMNRLAEEWLKTYRNYIDKYRKSKKGKGTEEELEEKFNEWKEVMDNTLGILYDKIFSPLKPYLEEMMIEKLIFIPHRTLYVFPLQAMYKKEKGKRKYLIEDYSISYSPGAGVLNLCRKRKRKKEKILTVLSDPYKNPTLPFAKEEIQVIKDIFGTDNCESLEYGNASPEKLFGEIKKLRKDIHILHISAHAEFYPENPLMSPILLTDEKNPYKVKKLTLEEIFTKIYIPSAGLVVLSACETGMIQTGSTDEFIGFPSGFLYSGSSSVISTLWSVSDLSSCLLMNMFYGNMKNKGMNKAEALREAQLWLLRDAAKELFGGLSNETIKASGELSHRFIPEDDEGSDLNADRLISDLLSSNEIKKQIKEFSHPYYWAAFCYYGD